MNRIGIIDIGSNSVRLIVFEIEASNSFRVIYELKEAIKLGKDMTEDKKLDKTRMKRAIDTIASFKTICESFNTSEIIAVATEAVRRASNRDEFVKLVKKGAEIDIRILSGGEEAYYDYMGVINSMDVNDCLMMDIGGSSTEFILVKDKVSQDSTSIPYGSISLTEVYNSNPNGFSDFFAKLLNDIPWVYEAKNLPIIGIGGTFRNIGKIDRKEKDYPIDNTHNYKLKNADLLSIYNSVLENNAGKNKKIKGLSSDRADIFIGPISAIWNIINLCGTNDIYISGSGVREGLLFEQLFGKGVIIDNALDLSLNNIMLNCDVNQKHSFKVYDLTNSLYTQLKHLMVENFNAERVIRTAALLHDCGIKLNFYDHHKHTFYTILNSRIYGLSHKELLMAAHVAALHRKDEFKIDLKKYSLLIDQNDADLIQQLGIILKIAEKLDFKMNSNVESLSCSEQDNSVILKLKSGDSAETEILGALGCKNTFKRLFNKNLIIV